MVAFERPRAGALRGGSSGRCTCTAPIVFARTRSPGTRKLWLHCGPCGAAANPLLAAAPPNASRRPPSTWRPRRGCFSGSDGCDASLGGLNCSALDGGCDYVLVTLMGGCSGEEAARPTW